MKAEATQFDAIDIAVGACLEMENQPVYSHGLSRGAPASGLGSISESDVQVSIATSIC